MHYTICNRLYLSAKGDEGKLSQHIQESSSKLYLMPFRMCRAILDSALWHDYTTCYSKSVPQTLFYFTNRVCLLTACRDRRLILLPHKRTPLKFLSSAAITLAFNWVSWYNISQSLKNFTVGQPTADRGEKKKSAGEDIASPPGSYTMAIVSKQMKPNPQERQEALRKNQSHAERIRALPQDKLSQAITNSS